MFFLTYLRRELRRRMRQSVFIVLGLALGVGLVVTTMAVSSGVQDAQRGVLQGLYGIGTDLTVTTKPPPFNPNANSGGMRINMTPNGAEVCIDNKCTTGAQQLDNLNAMAYAPMAYGTAAQVAKLSQVSAVGAGLVLTDQQMTIPATGQAGGGMLPQSTSFSVYGDDFTQSRLGPMSNATVSSGRGFAGSDANASVAVVDSDYAAAHSLKAGSSITIAKVPFKVIGLVSQPQGSVPPDAYIPLARAQALGKAAGQSLGGKINAVYVTATSAAQIPAVQSQIARLLPTVTVTSPSSLASEVTGSLASTAQLARDLGRWLSVLVLVTAFAVASLLTMAAVARRVREFGTLKALGWRSGRIISQVLGESVILGVLGGAVGVGIGFAGAAIVAAIAPSLTASVATSTGQHLVQASPDGTQVSDPTITHTVPVVMSAPVTVDAIVLAVALAVVGGLLAGSIGSWRIAQLRPAEAISRVA
jgi:putative ABC transport system permease protein